LNKPVFSRRIDRALFGFVAVAFVATGVAGLSRTGTVRADAVAPTPPAPTPPAAIDTDEGPVTVFDPGFPLRWRLQP